MKSAVALRMSRAQAQDMIASAIDNAPDLVTAMESVGAMYGIPASNILADPSEKGVKVVGDTIICSPSAPAHGNTNTVVRAISSVLDEISKRVDDKVNDIQSANIKQGEHDETLLQRTDPSKGKVVLTDKDANGDPVIVYDSGIIDCANNEAGRAKAMELRERENIPAMDPLKKNAPSYFNDDDDVRSGVDMECDQPINLQEYSIAEQADIHQDVLDAIGHFGDTRNLGYDIFTAHGFNCVVPMPEPYQEADEASNVDAASLKHMKFDNKYILDAIKYFNKARANQPNVKKSVDLDYKVLVNDPDFKKAIDCIDKQFDCKLGIKWALGKKEDSYAGTYGYETEISDKITVSKSKGFQLGRMPIWLGIGADGITKIIPDEPDLFGQAFTGIILHEIFHNIARACRFVNGQFITSLSVMIDAASVTRNPKTRRKIVEAYVDTLNAETKGKFSRIQRKLLVKNICTFVTNKSDAELAAAYRSAVPTDQQSHVDRKANAEKELKAITSIYRDAYNRNERRYKGLKGNKTVDIWFGVLNAIVAVLLHGNPFGYAFGILSVLFFLDAVWSNSLHKDITKLRDQYKNTKNMEEYYCDLFADMYQVPIRFFNAGTYSKYTANEVSQKTLDDFADIEKLVYETLAFSTYPTYSERTFAGVKTAKKLLENKSIDPAIKKYCQWIVDNESNILKTNVEVNYNSHTFDPKEAEDLDAHLVSLVKNNKMTVTESYYIQESYKEYNDWIEEGCVLDDDDLFIQEMFDLCGKIERACEMIENGYCDDTIFAESSSFKATGYNGESVIKRLLLFIPRLLGKLIQLIANCISNLMYKAAGGIQKIFISGNMYKININLPGIDAAIKSITNQLKVIEEFTSDADDIPSFVKSIGRFDNPKFAKKLDEDASVKLKENVELDGKDIVDCMTSIERISRNEMIPTCKRITKHLHAIGVLREVEPGAEKNVDKPEIKTGAKYVVNCINYAREYYSLVFAFITETKKERIKAKDELKAKKSNVETVNQSDGEEKDSKKEG